MSEMEAALARRRAMATGDIWADEIVEGKLWLGAGRDAENLAQLRRRRITHVLNAADDVPNFHEGEPDLTYHCLNITDFGGGSRHAYESAADFVRCAWAGAGTVLVHCANGSNRSATVAMALCMDLLDLTLAEAWALVCEKRSAAAPLGDNRLDLLRHESDSRGGVVTMREAAGGDKGGRLVPLVVAEAEPEDHP